ncbi:MAG: FAD:protein FMN transferase [Bacteroidales bacterium]|nr:FAD:protein FMN transferase [Bacteroidales bacterium]MCF8326784.1 FAD:protein FMN transferase [Bacteroidales bacterium]
MQKVIIFFLLATLMWSCQKKRTEINGTAQGTYYYISYFSDTGENLKHEIDSILDTYNQSVSTYEKNSVINRFNRTHNSFSPDSIFLQNLRLSLRIARLTNGAFDPTVAPLVDAWGFGTEKERNLDSTHLDSLKKLIGYQNIILNGKQVRKRNPRLKINFNAIAKGFSVDLIGDYLKSKGLNSYLVDIGGEVKTHGQKPGGDKWTVGIEKPANEKDANRQVHTILEIENMAVATSGNYRQYYEKDGTKYSHTINPKTGKPVEHNLLSASVITDLCGRADAFATAFMVMGKDKTLEFVKQNPGLNLEVMLIYADDDGKYQTASSPGFKEYIKNKDRE